MHNTIHLMTLGDKRRLFTEAGALLVLYARYLGDSKGEEWRLAGDQLKRCRDCLVGDDDGVHKIGLAEDFNLYINGIWRQDGPSHTELHDFWDLLGGAPRIKKDMNHYSFEHNGKW
jgi:hypothetical protein